MMRATLLAVQGATSVLMCPGPFPVAGSDDDSDPAQLSRCVAD